MGTPPNHARLHPVYLGPVWRYIFCWSCTSRTDAAEPGPCPHADTDVLCEQEARGATSWGN